MREIERRYLTQPVEFRAGSEGGPGGLTGYAAKFNTLSQNLGGFVETIAPGAFDKSLADGVRVMCRYNHADGHLLGTTDAGTLRLSVDEIGLLYDNDLPDTTSGRDCGVLAARGDVRFSSFAFICIADEWGVTEQGFPLRTLLQVQLIDVAPVNSPAYMDTTTAKRSLAQHLDLAVEVLETKPLEEIRGLILGETPEEEPAPETREDDEDEQRETHSSVPPSVLAAQLALDELK